MPLLYHPTMPGYSRRRGIRPPVPSNKLESSRASPAELTDLDRAPGRGGPWPRLCRARADVAGPAEH